MMDKPVLVIGGSGFLGSHVADRLSVSGRRVRIFDHVPSPWTRPDQEMIVGDLMDLDAVVAAAVDCGAIYNFAGVADIDDARDRPVDVARLNVLGHVHALEAARVVSAERFVFASSLYVFSTFGSFYRASKQSAEHFVEAYADSFGLDFTILRYGSLFGPRADRRNNIWRLIADAFEKRELRYRGDPDAVREYIHVRDAAALSVQVLAPEFRNRHVVLSGTERMKVADVMRMLAEMLPFDVALSFDPEENGAHYVLSPYRYTPKTGHKLVAADFVDIGQGLLECIAAIDAERQADDAAAR